MSGRGWFSRDARVWILNVGLIGAGVLAFSLWIRDLSPVGAPVELPWWALAAGFCVAEIFVVHLQFRRGAQSFSLAELPMILGLYFASPEALLGGQLVGLGLALALHRRQSPLKLVFNLSQSALAACTALAIFHAVLDGHDPLGPVGWAATIVATLAATVGSNLLIYLAICLSEGRGQRRVIVQMLAGSSVATFANITLGLAGVTVMWQELAGIWLVLVLAAVLFLANYAYASLLQKHRSLKHLYDATHAVQHSRDIEPLLANLLEHAREMFRAETAEILLFPHDDAAPAFRSTVFADGSLETMRPVRLDPAEGVWARVAAERQALLLTRPISNERLRAHFESIGIRDAMVAPLRGDGGVAGTMLVGNRIGEVRSFDADDLELFETLANHASVSLRNGRLIDELSRQAAANEYQALHDALTGLPNRANVQRRIDEALAGACARGSAAAVVLLDLDRFKEVNDTLGHQNGDLLLREVAARLRTALPEDATAARFGGDEFAVVLPHVDSADDAVRVAERIVEAVRAKSFVLRGLSLDVGASVGVALHPRDGDTADLLLQRADVAMYCAKRWQTPIVVYDREHDEYSPDRLALAAELRQAIEERQLFVVYQPKADLASGRIVGAEALVRWEHPRRGLVPPDEFVPLAERTGLIGALTSFVLECALDEVGRWRRDGYGDLTVAVNISARTLADDAFPDEVAHALARAGCPADALVLEITEGTVMAKPEEAIRVLGELRQIGVGLAVDDYGTGHSSLSYLSRLPVDELKIDRSFVGGMADSRDDEIIVRSTADLARSLGLRVVAEGVETPEVWNRLRFVGCHLAQGYYLSRPIRPAEFARWLAGHAAGRPEGAGDGLVALGA